MHFNKVVYVVNVAARETKGDALTALEVHSVVPVDDESRRAQRQFLLIWG